MVCPAAAVSPNSDIVWKWNEAMSTDPNLKTLTLKIMQDAGCRMQAVKSENGKYISLSL